jgi:hypothetical protein
MLIPIRFEMRTDNGDYPCANLHIRPLPSAPENSHHGLGLRVDLGAARVERVIGACVAGSLGVAAEEGLNGRMYAKQSQHIRRREKVHE